MSFNIAYKTLFQITVLHGYFLNNGTDEYNSLTPVKQQKILKNYDFENYISIIPTQETVSLLKNNHLVFKRSKNSFQVATKVALNDANLTFADVSLGLTLTFLIKVKDAYFENYSDLNITPNQLFYISNTKPVDEPVGFKYIPLLSDNVFINNDFKVTPTTSKKVLDNLITPEKNNVIGIVSITMQGDSAGLNILSNLKKIMAPHFKIHFNNRKTFWKYSKPTIAFEVETNVAKPLTQNGFVEITPADFTTSPPEVASFQYPNPSPKSIQKIASKIYSQIFI